MNRSLKRDVLSNGIRGSILSLNHVTYIAPFAVALLYVNTPMLYTDISYVVNSENFSTQFLIFFLFLPQTIACG